MSYATRFFGALFATSIFALPVSAQDASDGLALGDAVTTEIGQTYVREEHGDWEVRCVRVSEENGPDPCQIYQLLLDQNGNAVAEISIFEVRNSPNADAGATIITPLETLLTQGIRLSVDGSEERRYSFTFCSEIGCFARVGFTTEEVQAFRDGNTARLVIVPAAASDQTVDLTVSLRGFTAGFAAIAQAE